MSATTIVQTKRITKTESTFASVPVLDLALIHSPATKPKFLAQLREALVVVGFFYLKNAETWVPEEVQKRFMDRSKALSDLPLEKKQEIDMINSKHFLGYSRMGLERTAMKVDNREMFDFLSPLPPPGPTDPIYLSVRGPNQWPDENAVPGFRKALETYLAAVGELGDVMKVLVAEALDLKPTALLHLFDRPARNKVSLLKYPEPVPLKSTTATGIDAIHETNGIEQEDEEFQGVGCHKDGGFLTFLLQATAHKGLEAQNKLGQWIPIPPIPGTFVVNVGRSLESITGGVCMATSHRVSLSAKKFFDSTGRPLGPRYSYPVFQTLKLDLTAQEMLAVKAQLPKHITDLVKDAQVRSDAEAFFARYHQQSPGVGIFTARLTSHPDVGWRWYPEMMPQVLQGQREFKASQVDASMTSEDVAKNGS